MKWQHQDFGPTRGTPSPAGLKPHRGIQLGLAIAIGCLALGWISVSVHSGSTESDPEIPSPSSPAKQVSEESATHAKPNKNSRPPNLAAVYPRNFPAPDTVQTAQGKIALLYQPDSILQSAAEKYLRRYRPERAVIIACDLQSGIIRAIAERDSFPDGPAITTSPRLALGGQFPAASLSKIVTAFAALKAGYKPGDSLPQLGSTVTLYRRQVTEPSGGRYSKMTLKYGFAQSANPLFGLLGRRLGGKNLQAAAEALGFNRTSLPLGVSASHYSAPDTGYSLAEVASGFTQKTTLSPWHALELVRAIGDDGRIRPLIFSASSQALDGKHSSTWDIPNPKDFNRTFESHALREFQEMMQETVRRGTARKGFLRSMRAEVWNEFEMGGKTGSLDGEYPAGRYEWFAGYIKPIEGDGPGLALCVLTINGDYLAVHTTHLTGLLLKDWGRAQIRQRIAKEKLSPKAALPLSAG